MFINQPVTVQRSYIIHDFKKMASKKSAKIYAKVYGGITINTS